MAFPNVLITGHQAFFTREAMENIAHTTLANISNVEKKIGCPNRDCVSPGQGAAPVTKTK